MGKNTVILNNEHYKIDTCSVYDKYVSITFAEEINVDDLLQDLSKFSTITFANPYGFICSTYQDYDTVFKRDGNTVIFSNDGSVYEPIISIPEEPEPETPVIEPTLEDIKAAKIEEFRLTCEQQSENGVIVDINGVNEHFTYKKSEDQSYIKRLVDLASTTGLSVPYHSSDGGNCKLYTPEQIMFIYIAAETNLVHHLTYYNQMRQYIDTLEDIDTINALYYGSELTGKYLEDYNVAMEQTKLIINTVLSGTQETQTEEVINNGEDFTPETTEDVVYQDIVDENGKIIDTIIVSEESSDESKSTDASTGASDLDVSSEGTTENTTK